MILIFFYPKVYYLLFLEGSNFLFEECTNILLRFLCPEAWLYCSDKKHACYFKSDPLSRSQGPRL